MESPGDVLVTGAGRGLGRGISVAFVRAGWRVWIVSEVPHELERTQRLAQPAGAMRRIVADLSRPTECNRLVDLVSSEANRLRAVVNNAAILVRSHLNQMTFDDWTNTLAVNLTAPMIITQGLLPSLSAGGSVINVSSRAGVEPFAHESAYCASKFGLEAFSRSVALDVVDQPISINTITPGCYIKPTSLTDVELDNVPQARQNEWTDPVTLGPAFLFLAGLRGEVSGRRFSAKLLTTALERYGAQTTLERIDELYE